MMVTFDRKLRLFLKGWMERVYCLPVDERPEPIIGSERGVVPLSGVGLGGKTEGNCYSPWSRLFLLPIKAEVEVEVVEEEVEVEVVDVEIELPPIESDESNAGLKYLLSLTP